MEEGDQDRRTTQGSAVYKNLEDARRLVVDLESANSKWADLERACGLAAIP